MCYVITHLHCARKWGSQAGASAPEELVFHCPGCRAPAGNPRSLQFRCYCRQRRNPQLEPGLLPGSCGEPCMKPRGAPGSDCPHKCTELCHPGPCAPCIVQTAGIKCHCGREEVFRRCGDPVPVDGVSCGGICGMVHASCGHICERECHSLADVGECAAVLDAVCYCGKATTQLPCAISQQGYACGEVCGRQLSCGNHVCERTCHQGECEPCVLSPDAVTTCACGKTALDPEQRAARVSCMDPIPGCGQLCGKELGCLQGHKCKDRCGHEGECRPCQESVMVECRCGATIKRAVCGEDLEKLRERLICDRTCNDRLMCRRHNCQTVCCKFKKRKAISRSNVVPSERVWTETSEIAHLHGMSNAERRRLGHGCSETCGMDLQCGRHQCDLSCGHSGDCPPCGILVREALWCACGSEYMPGPVRCGTMPPLCRRPCSKVRDCGHPCPMNCHPGDCEPCIEPLKFPCVGGHGESRIAQCHKGRKGLTCYRACGKALLCGVHACRKQCHGDFPRSCEASQPDGCSQPCGLPRKKCGHCCSKKCHPGMICPETPCTELIMVSCPCGRRQEQAKCLRGGMGGPQAKDDAVRLTCDEECMAQSRLRAFASAVGKEGGASRDVAGSSLGDGNSTKYSDFLLGFAERELDIAQYFESELARIVMGKVKKVNLGNLPDLHRLAAHNIAELYHLESESVGRAPNRHVIVRHRGVGVKPVFPSPLLSEALMIREKQQKRSRQLESGRTLVIHVASSTRYPATAQIEARVEHQLRLHVGCYRMLGRATMSSNLIGVSVEFSTPERALLARNSLSQREGVTVETPKSGVAGGGVVREALQQESRAATNDIQSWNEGMQYGNSTGLRNGLPAPPPEVLVDENVPDCWDD